MEVGRDPCDPASEPTAAGNATHPQRRDGYAYAVRGAASASSSPGAYRRMSTTFTGTDAGTVPVTIYVRGFSGYGEFHVDDFTLTAV